MKVKSFLAGFALLFSLVIICQGCTDYDHDLADTPANRAGFERHFGFPPPEVVTGLYYYADELGADVMYQMGFHADGQVIGQIVADLELEDLPPEFPNFPALDFDWWDDERAGGYWLLRWKTDEEQDYYWILWYETQQKKACYLEYSI